MPVTQSLRPAFARWCRPAAAAITVISCLCLATKVRGDDKPAAKAKRATPEAAIALIDLKYVFDHDPGFQRAKSELDIEVKLAETMAALRKASIEKLAKDRQKHSPGSEEYRGLDRLLTQETAELSIQVELWKKQFVRREAELYHETYQRVQSLLDAYVEEQGISVVLRFNRTEVEDKGDAREVAVLLNRPIVAYKKPADITDEILRRLEKAPASSVVRRPKESTDDKR